MPFPWMQTDPTSVSFYWSLILALAFTRHRRPPTKLCLCDRQRKARSKMPESMDVLWVEGELKEGRVSTSQGVSGYLLEAVSIAPYETKPAKR